MVANGTIGNAFGATEIGVASEITFVKPSGEAALGANGEAARHDSDGVAHARG